MDDAKKINPDDLDWLKDVLPKVVGYAASQYFMRRAIRRAVRKADGPEWAVVLSGRLMLMLNAQYAREGSGLSKEMVEAIAKKIADAVSEPIVRRVMIRKAKKAGIWNPQTGRGT